MEIITKLANSFDALPKGAKVIIFSGVATITTLVVSDLEAFADTTNEYLAAVIGIAANLLTWVVATYLVDRSK